MAKQTDMLAPQEPEASARAQERARMHDLHRQGGLERGMAPYIVYGDAWCPHGCGQRLQAIDFRLENYEPAVHDPFIRAWFIISAKLAIAEEAVAVLPKLPEDWYKNAIIL